MREGLERIILFTAIAIYSLVFIPHLSATVIKELEIKSIPPGAEVYLKRGRKEVSIGKTPFVYSAEFHSDISILRMLFKKKAHKDLILEVSAGQDKVLASLEPLGIVVEPAIYNNPHLRKTQELLNPIIIKIIPELLEKELELDFDLSAPISVKKQGKNVFLVLPIAVGNLKEKITGTGKARQELLLKTMWNQIGGHVVVPLAGRIRNDAKINGILLDIKFDATRYLFGVKHSVETKTEMKCMPGTKMQPVWDVCARRVAIYDGGRKTGMYKCEGGTVMKPMYDPCAYKVPVTTHTPKLDPKATVTKDQGRAQYLLPLKILDRSATTKSLYEKLSILLTDSKGNKLKNQGSIPIPQ